MASSDELSDVEIPTSFEVFYREEYGSVLALVYGLSGSRWVAEDIAQEAFLRVHRDWRRVAEMESPDDAGRPKTVIAALVMAVALGTAPGCAAADHPIAERSENGHVAGEVDGSTGGRIAVVPLDSSLRRFYRYPD